MFKNILIIYSEKETEKHLDVVEKIKNLLNDRKFSIIKSGQIDESNFKDVDLIITIGGDGTFIRASHFLKKTPIFGINSEPENSEGALKSLKADELHLLKEMLNGKFNTIKRERIKLKINNKEIDKLALNEIFIGSEKQYHTSRYLIKIDGEEEEQRSSGVIVVTGSGSNAWYKSAGGAPFSYSKKELKFLVREPFSGRLFSSKLLKGKIKKGEKIMFELRSHYNNIAAIDSNVIFNLNYKDKVEIELANQPLVVITK